MKALSKKNSWNRTSGKAHAGTITLCLITSVQLMTTFQTRADLAFGGSPPYNSTVGCWYTPWWDTGQSSSAINWSYTRYNAYFKDANNNLELGHYTESVLPTEVYQSQLMSSVGIQFILSDLSNGVGVPNTLANTLQFEQNGLPAAASIGGPLLDVVGSQTLDTINSEAQQEADEVYNTLVTNQNYFQFSGLPLLVTYMAYDQGKTNVPLPYWYDNRFTVERATGMVDPNNPALDFISNDYNWDSWWGWNVKSPFLSTTCIAVCPGYDTTHFAAGSQQYQSRGNDGATYQNQWISAMQANPQVILISSWNDFNEENMIEPCEPIAGTGAPGWLDANSYQTSDLYLKITHAYTALKQNRLLNGFYYKDQSSSDVYEVQGSSLVHISSMTQIAPNSPIVTLPSNWLVQIISNNTISM